jgi:hypothetical protein
MEGGVKMRVLEILEVKTATCGVLSPHAVLDRVLMEGR